MLLIKVPTLSGMDKNGAFWYGSNFIVLYSLDFSFILIWRTYSPSLHSSVTLNNWVTINRFNSDIVRIITSHQGFLLYSFSPYVYTWLGNCFAFSHNLSFFYHWFRTLEVSATTHDYFLLWKMYRHCSLWKVQPSVLWWGNEAIWGGESLWVSLRKPWKTNQTIHSSCYLQVKRASTFQKYHLIQIPRDK